MSIRINPKMVKCVSLFLLSLVLGWDPLASASSSIERAKECFEAYIKALQQGSEEQAKNFWNKEEKESYKMYDWQWDWLTFWRVDPRKLDYRIISTKEKKGYVVLEVEWYYPEGKAGSLQKDVRYFIEENGKMVGANPVLIHTRGWLEKKSRHFIYHYKSEKDEPTSAQLEEMDRFYDKIIDLLQVDYQDEINYFKCDSSEEVGQLFGLGASRARSQTTNGVVASTQRFVPHEIVHIISYRILPPGEKRLPPDYLNEGLSYYLGGASFFSPELLLSWAKKKLNEDRNILLDSLISNPWIYGANDGAGLVSSFVKFLIDKEGFFKFKQLFMSDETYEEQKKALKEIFGKSPDQLQEEWKEFAVDLSLPEIKIVDPIVSRELLHIQDPLGDDKGDEDYIYPSNEKALPGIFDLTSFKISLDDGMVYFQLQFANLSHTTISSDDAFNGTFAAIAIDSDDKENSGNTQLFLGNGNFEFSKKDGYEFVIEVSNAGILLYDEDWVWHLLFLKVFSAQSHIRGREIFFAIPQKIIGIPDSVPLDPADWKFQVLTGGQIGGYKNTAYGVGRFMQVGQQATQDQGGGGTDTDFNSDVYDILTPRGKNQVQILSSYDVRKKRKAIIPMINLKER